MSAAAWSCATAHWLARNPLAGRGCAITNPNNRLLTNLVEERLWPESKGRRAAAAPLVMPLAVAALAVDAAVIHPLSSIDDAIFDARKMWWLDLNWDEQYISESAGLPFRRCHRQENC